MSKSKYVRSGILTAVLILFINSFSAIIGFSQTAPNPNPVEVLRRMQKTLANLKNVSFEVRNMEGYSLGKGTEKVRAVSKIDLRSEPYAYSGRLVGDDGTVYETVVSDNQEMRVSTGGEARTEDLSKGFRPNNMLADIALSWKSFAEPKKLQEIIASNNVLYGGQENVEGDMCDVIIYVESNPKAGMIRTSYFWISTTTNLPRAVYGFVLKNGESFAFPRRHISNFKINPPVDSKIFAYTPTAADSAAPKTIANKTTETSAGGNKITANLLNTPYPDVDVIDLAYKPGKFSDYKTKGKTTLVTFWATWCSPCLAEMPVFQKLALKYPQKFQVLAVASMETMEDSVGYVKKHPDFKFTFLLDPDWQMENSRLTQKFGIAGLPTNLLIGADGKIIDYWTGGEKEAELTKRIEAAILKN